MAGKRREVKEQVAAVSVVVLSFGFNGTYDRKGKGYYFSADTICISEKAKVKGILQEAYCKKIAEEFLGRYAKEVRTNLPTVENLMIMIGKKVADSSSVRK